MEERLAMFCPPPAVGEKNNEVLVGCLVARCDTILLSHSASRLSPWYAVSLPVKCSRDTLAEWYVLGLLVGPPYILFFSDRYRSDAARLTDRCNDHATKPRQASTHSPQKAKVAPTQMNTKPSGSFDLCMKGAPLVSGTISGGTPTPYKVGAFVSMPPFDDDVVDASWRIVEDAAFVDEPAKDPDFLVAAVPVDEDASFVVVAPRIFVSVARFGRSES